MKNNQEIYEFKYEGNFDSLDTLAVLHTQINFISMVREIKDLTYPEINLDLKMNGLEKGSLYIHHYLEVGAAAGITFMDGHEYIKNIFTILGDIISLKKFLKSSKPESIEKNGDNITISINGDNITICENAFAIYQKSPVITNAFTSTSQILESYPEVDSIEVKGVNSNEKVVDLPKENFPDLNTENPYLERKTDEQVFPNQILFIKKPNLFPEDKKKWTWDLIHKGRDIKAVITDPVLRKKINDGLRVGQGDRIKASLKIFYKFDERLQTFIESNKYEVNNIVEIINRPGPQTELPLEN